MQIDQPGLISAAAEKSNYHRYWQAEFNRPDHYPIAQHPDPARYRPIAAWMGRLILPSVAERHQVRGTFLEVYHTAEGHQGLVGQVVRLRWEDTIDLNARFWGVSRQVAFTPEAQKLAAAGAILAERVNGRAFVLPFESLAGAHPYDDIVVRLDGQVRVDPSPADGGAPLLFVEAEPTQITGRFYALVRFLGPAGADDGYRVQHYDRAARAFSGPEEVVRLPEVVPDGTGVRNSTAAGIEQSPAGAEGWYIYGAQDAAGRFVVQALAPRSLLRLVPQTMPVGAATAMAYIKPKQWRAAAPKGAATNVLLSPDGADPHAVLAGWHAGDRALLIHLFGGIGGKKAEPAAKTPLYWGHVAFGVAQVIREPLADELSFDIVYHQVYVHNVDGLTAGKLHYSRYSGDRQYGWLGVRPIQDILFKIDCITGNFEVGGKPVAALDSIVDQLEVMTARYRIADGRGGMSVGAVNNCAQDSCQALYAAIRTVGRSLQTRPDLVAELTDTPEEARRLEELGAVGNELKRVLLPWGSARADWEYGMTILGSDVDGIIGSLGKAVTSWRTMLPPVAARAIAGVFFEHGASAWVLRTSQVGGHDPDIEPYVPNV